MELKAVCGEKLFKGDFAAHSSSCLPTSSQLLVSWRAYRLLMARRTLTAIPYKPLQSGQSGAKSWTWGALLSAEGVIDRRTIAVAMTPLESIPLVVWLAGRPLVYRIPHKSGPPPFWIWKTLLQVGRPQSNLLPACTLNPQKKRGFVRPSARTQSVRKLLEHHTCPA